ncbi:SurA N-terminal domain-containing protein [Rhodobacteraceae bacterium D3-12]|nr:SurA N-terminal domain-containing protein [Rhodobacteraceae bacterium D3-12]
MARGSTSKTLVWILLGLLILGLGGFSATNFGGTLRSIGSVGDREITTNAFARAVQDEIRSEEARLGQPISMQIARALQIDQRALARLIAATALDNEAARLGISAGDDNLADTLTQIQGFRGIDGSFDRTAYEFYLDRSNMTEKEFEQGLRDDLASGLLQQAILSGMPEGTVVANTLVDYLAETRDFTWARLGEADLKEPLATPTEEQLTAFHKEQAAQFTLPERKRITYVWLTPDMILDQVKIGDDVLLENYNSRKTEFNQPERRLVERLVFPDEATAKAAKAAIDAKEKSFEDIVKDRGLALTDIDLGDMVKEGPWGSR